MPNVNLVLAPLLLCTVLPTSTAGGQAEGATSLRPYVLQVVPIMASSRARGGYDENKRYTQDLTWGDTCCLKASRPLGPKTPRPTMCVAAVIETMVEALNLYASKTGDRSFSTTLPMRRLDGSERTALIPLVFKYKGSNSPGSGYALRQLGLGRELDFNQLAPGDFITFNRTGGSGHAVVFLGYLTKGSKPSKPASSGEVLKTPWSKDVVGFRYFSAQGKLRPDGGLGYRDAYLTGKCPSPRGQDDDCNIVGVIVRNDGSIQQDHWRLSAGEMFTPKGWRTDEALAALRAQVTRSVEEDEGLTRGAGLEAAVDARLSEELVPDERVFVDGSSGEAAP